MQSSTLNGLTTYYVYDADGHRVMKKTGSASTTYIYDAFGQLAMEVGGTETPPCTTCFLTVDALGERSTTHYSYDTKGQLTQIDRADGTLLEKTSIISPETYTGLVESIEDPDGVVTSTDYDALGRPLTVTYPSEQSLLIKNG